MSILDTHQTNRLRVSFFNLLIIVVFMVATGCATTASHKKVMISKGAEIKQPSVRVVVERSADTLIFEGADLRLICGDVKLEFPDRVLLRFEDGCVRYRDRLLKYPVKLQSSKRIYINGRPYYGNLVLLNKNVINVVPLEEYIKGVLSLEVSPDWPLEALKAQAVVSRTFALYRIIHAKDPNYHLDNTVFFQRFEYRISNKNISKAVEQTDGEVLIYRGEVIEALYHSNSGGRTESCQNIFKNDLPYLRSIQDPYSLRTPYSYWSFEIDSSEFIERLVRAGYINGAKKLLGIKIKSRTSSGRVSEFLIWLEGGEKLVINGNKLRMVIGPREFKSLLITEVKVQRRDNDNYIIKFSGRGYGHGVGMSQWGAKVMAESGFNYRQILSFYYRGTTVRNYRDIIDTP